MLILTVTCEFEYCRRNMRRPDGTDRRRPQLGDYGSSDIDQACISAPDHRAITQAESVEISVSLDFEIKLHDC